ncbi:hypothetical protein [Clostridium hydrogenum]|nr:hypothetical protein [Clostridium hydrogenum]
MVNKKSKLPLVLSLCVMFLFSGLVFNYGNTLNLGVIPFHPVSYVLNIF